MAASSVTKVGKVNVLYDDNESGSEADSEFSNDLEDDFREVVSQENVVTAGEKKGLADVFAKILHKSIPTNKQVILAKGKTDRQIQKRKLETEEQDGDDKRSKKTPGKLSSHEMAREERVKLWENMCRSKPDPLQRDYERKLQKIATRGVVQLFNAVRQQQKTVDDELQKVGKSERKRDKVMEGMTKDKFLNILKGTKASNVKDETIKQKKQARPTEDSSDKDVDNKKDGKKWDILRDDYMMGARMKDWDKEGSDDDDDNNSGPGDPDMSDSD